MSRSAASASTEARSATSASGRPSKRQRTSKVLAALDRSISPATPPSPSTTTIPPPPAPATAPTPIDPRPNATRPATTGGPNTQSDQGDMTILAREQYIYLEQEMARYVAHRAQWEEEVKDERIQAGDALRASLRRFAELKDIIRKKDEDRVRGAELLRTAMRLQKELQTEAAAKEEEYRQGRLFLSPAVQRETKLKDIIAEKDKQQTQLQTVLRRVLERESALRETVADQAADLSRMEMTQLMVMGRQVELEGVIADLRRGKVKEERIQELGSEEERGEPTRSARTRTWEEPEATKLLVKTEAEGDEGSEADSVRAGDGRREVGGWAGRWDETDSEVEEVIEAYEEQVGTADSPP